MSDEEASMDTRPVIRGRLRLEVRDRDALVVATRRAHNLVLERGAQVVAALFSGAHDAGPIDRIGVGFAKEGADARATALTAPDDTDIPAAALTSPVAAADFTIATDAEARHVRVSVAARFVPTVDLTDVTEAGLLAGERLYNQVVFEPVTLRVGHDVTFFWDIDFPFGH
jgi:hypothetical protein